MFERFNDGAIKTIMLAQEEARRLGHNFVGTEHLLLGIIGERSSYAAEVLRFAGIELDNTRLEVEKITGRGAGLVAVEIPFTPRSKTALENGWNAARHLHFSYICPEHLLIGIIQDSKSTNSNGTAIRVLRELGVDFEELESAVLEKLKKKDLLQTSSRALYSSEYSMYERFTEGAIKAVMLAQEEARRLGHNFVGTEQILLGIIGEGESCAAKALKSVGLELQITRIEVEKIIGRGSGLVAVEIPFTPRSKRTLECSWEVARELNMNFISPDHLLLGIFRDSKLSAVSSERIGVAAKVLEAMGVDLNDLESTILKRLGCPENFESEPVPEQNLYQVLQVDPKAEYGLIRLAYLYLSDKFKNRLSKLEEINHAWEVLSDEKQRAEYDKHQKW